MECQFPDAMLSNGTSGGAYVADAGFVSQPVLHIASRGLTVLPFADCSPDLQRAVVADLSRSWPETAGSEALISAHWQGADALFVLLQKQATHECKPVGAVAVDRQRFHAFISHLYVWEKSRNKGYAKLLMAFAEFYVRRLALSQARVWCETRLVDFYAAQGYRVETAQVDGGEVDNGKPEVMRQTTGHASNHRSCVKPQASALSSTPHACAAEKPGPDENDNENKNPDLVVVMVKDLVATSA